MSFPNTPLCQRLLGVAALGLLMSIVSLVPTPGNYAVDCAVEVQRQPSGSGLPSGFKRIFNLGVGKICALLRSFAGVTE